MKKLLSMLLAVMMLATMAMGTVVASAEEAAPTTATAWLLYFASNHEKDQANFPWWPQHQRVDQPSSETGVEATNALVTGPGKYTVGLKFNWQKAEGAIQFNLIIDNAEVAFPGYYVDITEIRVNGTPIEVGENLYGTYHDDTNSGMAPIYNSYWDTFFTPDATGPSGYRSFDGTPEDANHIIINPDDIVNGDTIEVDFVFAAEAGAAPEELGAQPEVPVVALEAPPSEEVTESATSAWLYYVDEGWWPTIESADGYENAVTSPITVDGEGYYTVSAKIYNNEWWSPDTEGAKRLGIVIEDAATAMPNMYLNVTDIKVNGESIDFTSNIGYGIAGWDLKGTGAIGEGVYATQDQDGYAAIFDSDWTNNGNDMTSLNTWDGSNRNYANVDPSDFASAGGMSISISFFLSAAQNTLPGVEAPQPAQHVWYSKNTVGLAGLSLKDLGIADDWHNIVPVDLTKTGWQVFPLVASDARQFGHAYVAVNNGVVSVQFKYAGGMTACYMEHSQCIKWFTSLDEITVDALTSVEGGLTDQDAVNVQNDLGGADIAYLSINNKVTYRDPITGDLKLPRYWRNQSEWIAYRDSLMAMMPAAEAETEAAAE